MSTPTHLIGGYAILTFTQPWWADGLPAGTIHWLMIVGLLLSALIDLDTLWSPEGIHNHHQEFTHWPLTWITLAAITAGLSYVFPNLSLINLSLVILVATLFHLFLDLFGITLGIPLLAPFTRREFALTRLHPPFTTNSESLHYTLSHPVIFFREFAVITLSLLSLVR